MWIVDLEEHEVDTPMPLQWLVHAVLHDIFFPTQTWQLISMAHGETQFGMSVTRINKAPEMWIMSLMC